MTAIAASGSDLFSIITTGRGPTASLRAMLGLPEHGGTHLAYDGEAERRNVWAARLDRAVMEAEKPVLLVAGGVSCYAAAWWARLSPSSYVSRIAGALLLDPALDEEEGAARFASPRIPLPFPSIVVSGRKAAAQARLLAENWGSGLAPFPGIGIGSRRNGKWQAAQEALARITGGVVERRLRVAEALSVRLD